MGLLLLIIPLLIGVLAPPFRLIIVGLRELPPGEKPTKYNGFAGQVSDVSTILFLPVLGFAALGFIDAGSPASVIWFILCLIIMVAYFFAVGMIDIRSPTLEFVLNGLMAAGVTINITMGFWPQGDLAYLLATGPIACLLLYAMVKRHQYLTYRIDTSGGVTKYAHEDIIDNIQVEEGELPAITARSPIEEQLLRILHLSWPGRFLAYTIAGGLIILASILSSLIFGASIPDAFDFYLHGPN